MLLGMSDGGPIPPVQLGITIFVLLLMLVVLIVVTVWARDPEHLEAGGSPITRCKRCTRYHRAYDACPPLADQGPPLADQGPPLADQGPPQLTARQHIIRTPRPLRRILRIAAIPLRLRELDRYERIALMLVFLFCLVVLVLLWLLIVLGTHTFS